MPPNLVSIDCYFSKVWSLLNAGQTRQKELHPYSGSLTKPSVSKILLERKSASKPSFNA